MALGLVCGLNYDEVKKLRFAFPPLPEQRAIAARLDEVTGKIERAAAKIKTEIERLEAYKKSVICEAVCGRIDLSRGERGEHGERRPMKDSGIPWVGKIPQGWGSSQLGFEVIKLNRALHDDMTPLICSNKGRVEIRTESTMGQVSQRVDGCQGVHIGDLLIHGMDTWHGAIAVSDYYGKCTTVVHVCEALHGNDKRYLSFYLRALAFLKVYKSFSNGVRQNTSDFRSWAAASKISIILPMPQEQKQIADMLEVMECKVDDVIGKRKRQLEELDALKRSLVYEYVTGKKEVNHE